jgi:predicted metal-binding membrane protein
MSKNMIAIAMLAAGIALLVWGFNMSEAFDSKLNRAFTGSPTDKAMWAMIGGAVLAVAGTFQLLVRRK